MFDIFLFIVMDLVLLGFLSFQAGQVIQNFPSPPVEERSYLSLKCPALTTRHDFGLLLCHRKWAGLPLGQHLQACQGAQLYQDARDLPEDRTQTQLNHMLDRWWFVFWVETRQFTFSPSVPVKPRSPTSPGWPSGPCKASNTNHKYAKT